jgi:hypothetical protein
MRLVLASPEAKELQFIYKKGVFGKLVVSSSKLYWLPDVSKIVNSALGFGSFQKWLQ